MTIQPLLQPISWAVLLAFMSYPLYGLLYEKVFRGRLPSVCAACMTVFIMAAIIAPTIMVGSIVAGEAVDIYVKYQPVFSGLGGKPFQLNEIMPAEVAEKIKDFIQEYPRVQEFISDFLSLVSSYMVQIARGFLGNTLGIIYSLLIIFISYFFLVRDGHVIINYLTDIVPLVQEEQIAFMQRAKNVLRAVVYGVIFTAIVQGMLGAIGWWFVGLSNPVMFGSLMALMAMIPFVGTPSVWIPGALYLFFLGDYKGAAIMLAWGTFVVSSIDNFLRPYFISGNAKMSVMLVFLGAFGGLAVWGFIGLFAGPLILSLFAFFLDSYREIWKKYLHSDFAAKQGLS